MASLRQTKGVAMAEEEKWCVFVVFLGSVFERASTGVVLGFEIQWHLKELIEFSLDSASFGPDGRTL